MNGRSGAIEVGYRQGPHGNQAHYTLIMIHPWDSLGDGLLWNNEGLAVLRTEVTISAIVALLSISVEHRECCLIGIRKRFFNERVEAITK